MKNKGKPSPNPDLRKYAEELLKMNSSKTHAALTEFDYLRLIHELEVHQIELELQKEELSAAKEKVDLESQRYTELYDFAPVGYFTLSRTGQILELNLSGAKLLGTERARIKNRMFGSFVADESQTIFNQFLFDLTSENSTKSYEVKIRSGERSFLNVIIKGTISENGKQCFLTATDITERKHTEEMLRESEDSLNEAQRIAKIGSWEWDMISGKVNWSNEMFQVFDIDRDNFDGDPSSILKVIHPDDIERFSDSMKDNLLKGNSPTLIYRVIHRDGSVHTIQAEGRNYFNDAGIPIRNIGTAQDITERKKAEEDRKLINKMNEELLKHMTDIRENERALISREIHDQLGQAMTALKLDLNWLQQNASSNAEVKQKLDGMVDIINTTIKDVQRISSELRPGILDDLGLAAAIEWYCEEFENRTGLMVDLNLDEVQIQDEKASLALFRVMQESLTNVIRHAQAKSIKVSLHEINEHVVLDIEDDGIGISIDKLKSIHSLGLLGMHDRIKQVGGTLDILFGYENGTKLRICVPLLEETE